MGLRQIFAPSTRSTDLPFRSPETAAELDAGDRQNKVHWETLHDPPFSSCTHRRRYRRALEIRWKRLTNWSSPARRKHSRVRSIGLRSRKALAQLGPTLAAL